jgi:hypothetical protein
MGWRVNKRLSAVSEDGALYTIVQLENGGEIDFVMDSGWAVTRRPDGTFRIDETGEILRIVGS